MPEQQLVKEELNIRVDSNSGIDSDMEKLAALFARYSLDLRDTPPLGATPLEIAKSLSSVKIEDPHIVERVIGISNNPNEATADDFFFIGALALGAAMVREKNSYFTQKEKKDISHYKDKIKSEAGRKIAGVTRKAISTIILFSFINSACGAKITPSSPDLSPTSGPVPTESLPPPIITVISRAKEIQIAPSPTQETMKNILLTSVEVMTKEQIEADPLLSDSNFQEGINNYVQETREIRELSEESTTFELVVIKGIKDNGDKMYFPFAAWTAQNEEGLNFIEMLGLTEEGKLEKSTLVCQEMEKDGILYYTLIIEETGAIFAIPASEIENPDAQVFFNPSGKALETTETIMGSKVLFALRPEIKIAGLTQKEIEELNSQISFITTQKGLSGIRETIDDPALASIELISSGVFENSDLFDINTGEAKGEITTLTAVSRDEDGNPITLRAIVQAELFSEPNVNKFPMINKILLVMGGLSFLDDRVKGNTELTDLDEWEERMPRGSMWTFNLHKNPTPDIFINSTYYTSSEYNKDLSDFIRSGGIIIPDDFIVVPAAVESRYW